MLLITSVENRTEYITLPFLIAGGGRGSLKQEWFENITLNPQKGRLVAHCSHTDVYFNNPYYLLIDV